MKKGRFKCDKCRLWYFWTQNNQGKCPTCYPRKQLETQKVKKK